MKAVLGWWPCPVMLGWLYFIQAVAGYPAAAFSAITGLAICLLALWEAGGRKASLDEKEG